MSVIKFQGYNIQSKNNVERKMVMTLTIDGLLSEISLPKRYFSNEFVIAEKFGDESTTYLQLLDRCIGDECYDDTQRQLFLQI